ncbi:MFS transporter [Yinghuangia soli]|uniref:MFS transporter n=1 Tax=Yinghuangia soli TaxID=2908204 RepID=A0AA41PYW2_9ACTN|nr:MFS transporter [Yinghuangia soli]MCF2527364.1 MFS transporter [Yinghuangia soli]
MPSRALFRNRVFRRVWAGEALSGLGDLAFEVAFLWLVLEHTGSPALLAAVLVVQAVPRGVLMLLGGAVTDRVSPRTVLLACHLVRAAAVLALGAASAAGQVHTWQFFALGLAAGAAEAFSVPAGGSILPQLVPHDDLARANAWVGFGEQGGRLAGPVLGGALVVWAGTATAAWFNAATFLAAAAAIASVPRRQPAAERPAPAADGGPGAAGTGSALRRDITAGLAYARRSRDVRTVLLLVGAATLSYAGLFAVGLPALAATYPDGPMTLGLLVSAWGLGQLLGSAAAAATGLPERWGLLIVGMTLTEGAAFAVLGFAPTAWGAAALLAMLGFGVAYSSDVALPTYVQTRTPPEYLGRVNSVIYLPRVVLEPVSVALMGVVVAAGVRWGFAAAAVPMLAVGLLLAADPRARGLRTTPTAEPG